MTIALVLIAKEKRIVARFREAGATSREKARTIDEIGVSRGVPLRRLRERAVLRESAPGQLYLDEESWSALRRVRRRATLIVAAIAIVLICIGLGLLATR